MPQAEFYLITTPQFRDDPWRPICELAKRAFEAGEPALILTRSVDDAERLDELLWAFDAEAFVPHQIAGDEDDAITPVLIVPPGVTAAERALVINLREEPVAGRCQRVLELVPAEAAERAGSRKRWREYQAAGFTLAKHDL
jgi:DNA polymerase-3 subunit chi